ncbi:MAG TPA: GspH/FimT family pseudopilin [Gammaproteobacteria bacterium]|nr:GspH/FimT family pseudopilin [Gammaproteobacteria bacterium]
MKAAAQNGFTLYELLVTLMVAGILFGVGVPNFMEFQRNGAMSAAANQLVTGMLMARAEAVKRQVPVTLCLSDNPNVANPTCLPAPVGNSLTRGFIVWADESGPPDANGAPVLTDASDGDAVFDAGEQLLMQSAAPGGTMQVSADCGYVSFAPNGFPRPAPGLCAPATRVLYCDDRGNRATSGQISTARAIRIEATGRGQVLQEVGDVTAVVAGPLAGVAANCP